MQPAIRMKTRSVRTSAPSLPTTTIPLRLLSPPLSRNSATWNWKGTSLPPNAVEVYESEEGEGDDRPAGGRAGRRAASRIVAPWLLPPATAIWCLRGRDAYKEKISAQARSRAQQSAVGLIPAEQHRYQGSCRHPPLRAAGPAASLSHHSPEHLAQPRRASQNLNFL